MLYNRDLSWLGFNHRVLQEAADESVPLYERIKFLAIFSSNLDEFFRVRFPEVVALSKLNKKSKKKDDLIESDISTEIHGTVSTQLSEFGDILLNKLLPALRSNKVNLYYKEPFLEEHKVVSREIFLSKVLSFIQPIILNTDSERLKNFLPENNELFFVVTLRGNKTGLLQHTLVNIPSHKLQRFFELPKIGEMRYIAFIDDIVRENLPMLFPDKTIEGIYSLKINRNADLVLSDDYASDLSEKMEKQLSARDFGETSRFLYEAGMPVNLRLFLTSIFKVKMSSLFEGGRYHNLSNLFNLPVFDSALCYPKTKPLLYPSATANGDIFNVVSGKDVLLHLPYHSYSPVLSFFNQAAVDESVKEIYITLYRVAKESHIVNALISAAKNGKKVTAFIELKARFDEENNIKWSKVMKNAGVRLVYSELKLKVHSKIALVKRVEDGNENAYSVISTGNFNESTASFYTDHVLFTKRKGVGGELERLFHFLEKKKPGFDFPKLKFSDLYVTQFNLIKDFEKLINAEVAKVKNGEPGLIRIKVNNLEEPDFIQLLYKAAMQGVKIRLLVRSICCIVPGVEGLSENIEVRRIVDKYLEHTRLFIFGEDDKAVVAMGSSDLMTRNLKRRIEVCVKIKDKEVRKQLLDYFNLQWRDNTKATRLLNSMMQEKVEEGNEKYSAQADIQDYIERNNE